jgi:hypothetical protein
LPVNLLGGTLNINLTLINTLVYCACSTEEIIEKEARPARKMFSTCEQVHLFITV